MDNILQILQQKGHRLTHQRQLILDALTTIPQSVEEVITSLNSKGKNIDMVTVYRTLDCFVELGVVGKTQFKDKTGKYELLTEDHHHHLVCDHCGSVEDIALNEAFLIRKVSEQTKFQVKSHSLEFFGLCANCR
ncbi:MAG: Fur family transcriptional regulator [Candidatus Gottesmanbacteria bacterium]